MSRDLRRLQDYLGHIIEAIEKIDRYTRDIDEVVFLTDLLLQDAVIRNLEVIGEASNSIQKHHADFTTAHPELPLAAAYQMRDALVHGYAKVDHELVWRTIQNDLPDLHLRLKVALACLPDRPAGQD